MKQLLSRIKEKKVLHQFVKTVVTVLVVIIVIASFSLLEMDTMVNQLEMKTYDLRTQLKWTDSQNKPSDDIVIIEFDDLSLNLLTDEYGVWPWSRQAHARMIHYLNQLDVRTVLYDIMFVAHRKGDELSDQKLIDAFRQYDNIYFSMNFDNALLQNRKLGKGLTPQDLNLLEPFSMDFHSELDDVDPNSDLELVKRNGYVVFDNTHMYFNHYRSLMTELLRKKSNIGFINHGNDRDGVSRANPLFYCFEYQPFAQTSKKPLKKVGQKWFDQDDNWVNEQGYLYQKSGYLPVRKSSTGHYFDHDPEGEKTVDKDGYLLDSTGKPLFQRSPRTKMSYFPYLGLQALIDMKFPGEKIKFTLTKNGELTFKGYTLPLRRNGDFLLSWHNNNVRQDENREQLQKLEQIKQQTLKEFRHYSNMKDHAFNPKIRRKLNENNVILKKIALLQGKLKQLIDKKVRPEPYRTISAWEIIRNIQKREAGMPLLKEEKKLEALLKDKIVFIGATAVAAYDLKNTSIDYNLPGVVMQANLFDNLYQILYGKNTSDHIHQASSLVNMWISVILSLLVVLLSLRLRSAFISLMAIVNITIIYILIAILAFQRFNLWINVAMPLFSIVTATIIVFIVKYILRDQDYEKTYVMATTDSMTGLYNHRFFQEHIHQCINRSERTQTKFSLLLIDIDFFKKFNDSYGHQAGDEVLRQVAKKLKKLVRVVDVVARYGGEEMAIILDDAAEEAALSIAEKVVEAIAEEPYPISEGVSKHVTISCGVATYPTHGKTPTELIEFSDLGLYRAKEGGRNQVGKQYDDD